MKKKAGHSSQNFKGEFPRRKPIRPLGVQKIPKAASQKRYKIPALRGAKSYSNREVIYGGERKKIWKFIERVGTLLQYWKGTVAKRKSFIGSIRKRRDENFGGERLTEKGTEAPSLDKKSMRIKPGVK